MPQEFLRKIAQALAAAGIIQAVRGRRGGLRLARAPEEISLLDVMEALNAGPSVNRCFIDPSVCERYGKCSLQRRLAEVQRELTSLFGGIALSELLATHEYPAAALPQEPAVT